MEGIKWTKKVKQYRNVDLSNAVVEIYTGGNGAADDQDNLIFFKFIKNSHKSITRTKCLNIGVNAEGTKLYFVESMPDTGYTVNEFKGNTSNSILQLRKKTAPEVFEAVKKCEGKYFIKRGYGVVENFYIDLIEKDSNKEVEEKSVEEAKEDIDEKHISQEDYSMLLAGLNKIYLTQTSILECLKALNEQNKELFEVIKQMNSSLNTGTEKIKAIFTEVKYNNR